MHNPSTHRSGPEAWAVLRAAERVRLRMQMERGDDTPATLEFALWLWHDRWMTRQKWTALPPRDREAYLSAYLRESAARRMIDRAYGEYPAHWPAWKVAVCAASALALLITLWLKGLW
jgi:hypothetical protein